MTTKTNQAFRPIFLLAAVLIAGIYSCNNNASTEEKKADSAAAVHTDSIMKQADTMKMPMPADTTNPSDTGREIKVPKPSK
ncbi:hypothetical protein [Pinibacter aurantiacus]|uniref:Uncharacterized protein n=1 Tax=Pinibacter aurantiacus TaxID=2851599 RepID=A0A9E2W536_9BACT|nr:hypothetical protein [Pinibacter aurantiacus]MBV4360435.1 hypothetical protein [Pinibacter aurantiacus]